MIFQKRKSTKLPAKIAETLRPYSDYITQNLVRCKDCRTPLSLKDSNAKYPAAYSETQYYDPKFKKDRTAYYCKDCTDVRESTPNGDEPSTIVCITHSPQLM